MGYHAVELLLQGKYNQVVCYRNARLCSLELEQALQMSKGIDEEEWTVMESMTGI